MLYLIPFFSFSNCATFVSNHPCLNKIKLLRMFIRFVKNVYIIKKYVFELLRHKCLRNSFQNKLHFGMINLICKLWQWRFFYLAAYFFRFGVLATLSYKLLILGQSLRADSSPILCLSVLIMLYRDRSAQVIWLPRQIDR